MPVRPGALALIAALAAVACGGGEPEADPDATAGEVPAAPESRPPGAEPGLPMDSVGFEPAAAAVDGLTGTLWISTSRPQEQDGLSLIAQLEGVPTQQAYSWAIHRGACGEPDDVVMPLGYGTEADGDEGRSVTGGPLGETRAAFEPSADGGLQETVWVPLNGVLSRADIEGTPHSLRIHPDAGDGELEPAVACAPIPGVPTD